MGKGQQTCEGIGAELPLPLDSDANNDLAGLMILKDLDGIKGSTAHISLRADDVDSEGNFIDSRLGTLLDYANWDSNQPNDYQSQDYVTMHNLGKWHDYNPPTTAFTICQK